MLRPLLTITLVVLNALIAPRSSAQELLWTRSGEQGSSYGRALAVVGDLDGDGFPEVAVGGPHAGKGSVELLRSTDGSRLDRLEGDVDGWNFGQNVAGGRDLDLDGVPDLVVAQPDYWSAGARRGRLLVYSGVDRRFLHDIQGGYDQNGGFAHSLAMIPDIDGDGAAELLAGNPAFGWDYRGRARLWSGIDGHLIDTWGGGVDGGLGAKVGTLGDVTGDGVDDFFVTDDSHRKNRVLLRDGATRAVHARILGDPGQKLGTDARAIGDLTGDGVPELLVSAPTAGVRQAGRVDLHDGATQAVLYSIEGPEGSEHFGNVLSDGADVNGDGVVDYLVSSTRQVHRIELHSGDDGRVLYVWHPEDLGSSTGWLRLMTLGDLTGDGLSEIGWAQGSVDDARGLVSVARGNDVFLSADRRRPRPSDGLSLTISGRHPQASVGLYLVGIDGTPQFTRIALGKLDAQARWTLSQPSLPSSLVGSTLEFLALVQPTAGGLELSAVESVSVD